MKWIIGILPPLFLSAILLAHPDEPTSPDNKEVMWHTVTLIDYKPGTQDTARDLVRKFEAASRTAGTVQAETHWLGAGKYDLVVTWKLQNGPADLQGKWSPAGDAWWEALVSQEGSEEAATKLQDEYNNLIASSVTSISRIAK